MPKYSYRSLARGENGRFRVRLDVEGKLRMGDCILDSCILGSRVQKWIASTSLSRGAVVSRYRLCPFLLILPLDSSPSAPSPPLLIMALRVSSQPCFYLGNLFFVRRGIPHRTWTPNLMGETRRIVVREHFRRKYHGERPIVTREREKEREKTRGKRDGNLSMKKNEKEQPR